MIKIKPEGHHQHHGGKQEKLTPRGSKHDKNPVNGNREERSGVHSRKLGDHGHKNGDHGHKNGDHGHKNGEHAHKNGDHGHKPGKHSPTGAVNGSPRGKQARHSLKELSLSPPDYYIDPQKLLSDFVEEEVAFAGRIDKFPVHEDVTNRTTVLRTIDKGKKRGIVSWGITPENRAILTISVRNIKIIRAKNEELLLRVSTHQIAAISYIKDDRQHILALKHGDPKSGCELAVIYCENKTISEEICALVSQCFQLVYTDATMDFIDKEFESALTAAGPTRLRTDSNSSVFEPTIFGSQPTRGAARRYAFLTRSSNGSAYSSSIYRSLPGRGAASSSTDSSSWSAAELLQDYLNKLHKKLTSHELKTFAQLLTTRHTDLTFTQFCDKVLQLFGEKRKNLMTGLWPFIAERDHTNFEKYLERNGISPYDDSGYWSMPSSASQSTGREEGPVIVRYMDSVHYEDSRSPNQRSLTSHSDPGPGRAPAYNIRFMDNVHYTDPFVTIP
ncbi:cerebral cavernous malformations protein 2 homolog [Liolophura sinensis]|uniref:cerebral cavernous malformations protein 2 homolog n=1 Tax=Liolophura sinensis TaxID=3198878 RepID=UPI003158F492